MDSFNLGGAILAKFVLEGATDYTGKQYKRLLIKAANEVGATCLDGCSADLEPQGASAASLFSRIRISNS
jgi:hypothetical protein